MSEDYSTRIFPELQPETEIKADSAVSAEAAPEPTAPPAEGWLPGDLPTESLPDSEPSSGQSEPLSVISDQLSPETITHPQLPITPPIEMPSLSLDALVEALLFVADGPVTVARLAEAMEVNARAVEGALTNLAEAYAGRGLSLQRHRDKVQLTSHPAAAAQVERFLGLAAATALSKAALETLAIIAYQQPVTRPQIESVRGVNSDSVIKNLLSKGLIEEAGRTEGPGRPVLYATTSEFLQHFGLTALTDLPPLNLDAKPSLEKAPLLKG
jgi:segregation and condensation protein B